MFPARTKAYGYTLAAARIRTLRVGHPADTHWWPVRCGQSIQRRFDSGARFSARWYRCVLGWPKQKKPRSFDAGAERTELFDHGIPYRRAHVAMGIRCDTSVFDKTRQANGHSMKRVMILCLSAVKEIVLHVGVGTVVYFLLCLYRWITFFSFVSIIVSITVFVKWYDTVLIYFL